MISIVLAGRNDDYGGAFRDRLFRAAGHNASRLSAAGVEFEFVLGEWNSLPGRPLLAEEFVSRLPGARAVVVPPAIHDSYSLNPAMPFHEMAAKNAALRRTRGGRVVVTNADIVFGDRIVEAIARRDLAPDRLWRAHRIDVDCRRSWPEMQDPSNHLPSGEGRTLPCWYLGAAGDFCLASRMLWMKLRGFNERARFSTRAKDWQFFLSAAARGVGVEFTGDVYHLDHAGGFRNTPREAADAGTAHFGGAWDIEFGLPLTNPDDWGFASLREHALGGDPRIAVLDPAHTCASPVSDRADRLLAGWLTRPDENGLESMAALFQTICAAHAAGRRLICRLEDPRLAVALSGFTRIASRHGVSVFCNWEWPDLPGYSTVPFAPEPDRLAAGDLIAAEIDGTVRVSGFCNGRQFEAQPVRSATGGRPFNPVMIRRLLRACLRLQEAGARRIGIYGAGSHTGEVLGWGLPPALNVAAVVVSEGSSGSFQGVPMVPVAEAPRLELDALLLSSVTFEPEMLESAGSAGIRHVVPLYGDWPADMWAPRSPGAPPSADRCPDGCPPDNDHEHVI